MFKPTYKLQFGSETFEPSVHSPVVSVRVRRDINIPADCAKVLFSVSDETSKIKEGDDASVQLGYDDETKDVFKGAVDLIVPQVSSINLTSLNHAIKLLELRINQVYEEQNAGKIVSDIVGKAGVKTDKVEDGLSFPVYVVDDTKNVYEHIRELADKCGFDAYMTPDNKLVFKAYERSDPHVFEYGKNIIGVEVDKVRPMVSSVTVQGESPSSFKGADTSHWLTKRRIDGLKGDGSNILVQDPTVRDKDTAEKVAKVLLDRFSRKMSGTLRVIGQADVNLGDTIEIKGMSDTSLNGEFQVRSVDHVINRASGFTTSIGWRK